MTAMTAMDPVRPGVLIAAAASGTGAGNLAPGSPLIPIRVRARARGLRPDSLFTMGAP